MNGEVVKPGYKKTEVGMIPEDWRAVSLLSCLTTTPDYGINAPSVMFDDSLPTYLRITDISDDYRFKPFPRVSVKHPNAELFYLSEGDLVFARTGASVGKSYLYNTNDGELVFAGYLIRVKINATLLEPRFLSFYVQSKRYWDWVATMSIRSGQPGINGQEYGSLHIPLPPLPEQHAIAAALSDADGLIRALETLIEKKRTIKQGAMQQLLTGRTRLPGFAKSSGYKNSEVGVIPEDWNVEPIGRQTDLLTGFPFPSNQYSDSGVRLLRGSNIKRGDIDWSDEITEYWNQKTSDFNRFLLNNGDLVISLDGTLVGRSYAQITSKDIPSLLVQRVARLRSEIIDIGFLRQFIGSEIFVKYSDSVKTVTAIPHISPEDIKKFAIPIPSIMAEQHAIAAALSDMDTEIAALEQRLEKTRQIKQGMMQQLLTGKVRLVTAEVAG